MTLRGMGVPEIIESLKYYVEIGQIKKKEPARKYISAVGQWFEFLFETADFRNNHLKEALRAPSTSEESYNYQCNGYIDNCDLLKEKEPYPPLNEEQVAKLLEWTKSTIEAGLREPEKDIAFKRLVAALCIKLMLYVGIAYRRVRTIRFSDYNEQQGTLEINGYKILLPLGLVCELREYKRVCRNKGFNIEEGYLFVTTDGEQWHNDTSHSGIPTFLGSLLNIFSVNSVVKYGVQQLLLQYVSDSVILNLTGVRKEILQDCTNPTQENEEQVFSYINSKLVKTPIYQKL